MIIYLLNFKSKSIADIRKVSKLDKGGTKQASEPHWKEGLAEPQEASKHLKGKKANTHVPSMITFLSACMIYWRWYLK